jgi:GNAT superfamily N-acetyltransferase
VQLGTVSGLFTGWFWATLGRPHWHHYLACDDGIAVSTAALYVDGGVGWLGFGATLPSHRNRGAQSALMARRIRDAADAGCSLVHTETAESTDEVPNPS